VAICLLAASAVEDGEDGETLEATRLEGFVAAAELEAGCSDQGGRGTSGSPGSEGVGRVGRKDGSGGHGAGNDGGGNGVGDVGPATDGAALGSGSSSHEGSKGRAGKGDGAGKLHVGGGEEVKEVEGKDEGKNVSIQSRTDELEDEDEDKILQGLKCWCYIFEKVKTVLQRSKHPKIG
jgi:hypothetical protein